jgi:hypothetical protein
MKCVAFVLLDGLSVFNHENVEYKPRTDRPIKEPTGIIGTRPVKPFGNRDQLEGNNRYLSGLSG